jgi:hypothetical protein
MPVRRKDHVISVEDQSNVIGVDIPAEVHAEEGPSG